MNLWKGKQVIVGKPGDGHNHLQTGDSVVAVSRAQARYEEDVRRYDRQSAFVAWASWLGGFLVFMVVFILCAPNMAGWMAFVLSAVAWGAWILFMGVFSPDGGG